MFNIKTGRGGLVDVEFLVQYLQLVHGPTLPSLRQRATGRRAGGARARRRRCPPTTRARSRESYAFLRRLENRLRIVHDRSIQQITDRRRRARHARASPRLSRRRRRRAPARRLPRAHRAHPRTLRALPADGTVGCKTLRVDTGRKLHEHATVVTGRRRSRSAGCATTAASPTTMSRGCPSPSARRSSRRTSRSTSPQSNLDGEAGARRGKAVPQDRRQRAGRVEVAPRGGARLRRSRQAARDDRALREASRDEDAARDQLIAARAKLDYADRLVELREAKIARGARRNLNAAEADVELTKLQLAQRNGMAAASTPSSRRAARTRRSGSPSSAPTSRRSRARRAQLKTAWDD